MNNMPALAFCHQLILMADLHNSSSHEESVVQQDCGSVQIVDLELKYKSCYARILDSKRRFLEAATRYYDLSQIGSIDSDAGIKVRCPCCITIAQIVAFTSRRVSCDSCTFVPLHVMDNHHTEPLRHSHRSLM